MWSKDLLKWGVAFTSVAFVSLACQKAKKNDPVGNPCAQTAGAVVLPTPTSYYAPVTQLNLAAVSYNTEVRLLIASNCSGGTCHSTSTSTGPASPNLSDYNSVKLSASQALSDIRSGIMPKGKTMATLDKTNFEAWVNGGYLQDANSTSTTTTSPIVSSVIAYDNVIKPLIDQYCVSCHRLGGTQPSLSSAQEVQVTLNGILPAIRGTTGRIMPPLNAIPLPLDKKNLFEQWATGGYQMSSVSTTSTTGGVNTTTAATTDCTKNGATVMPTPTRYY